MPDDAVYVYCNMTNMGETCVFPDIHSSQMPNIPWRKEEGRGNWYSKLRGGFRVSNYFRNFYLKNIRTYKSTFCHRFIRNFQITYETIGVIQLNFLRLLSEEGYQNFTYTCMNSAGWYDATNDSYDLSLRLLGENETEFSYYDTKPIVVTDGCKSRKSKGETVLLVRTEKLQRLPLVDFHPVDYGSPHQAFGFNVGPLCLK